MTAEGVEVFEVKSKNDLDDFIKLPYLLYSKDPFYVPPLIKEIQSQFSDKNPFFLHATARYFLSRKDGKFALLIRGMSNFIMKGPDSLVSLNL
jgi:hypothetical protein